MAFNLLVALAPALACLLLCVCVEGSALWERFLKRLRTDEPLLELLAELTVHLSTYGSAVVGWVLHLLVGEQSGALPPVVGGLLWFVVLLRISLWLREMLKNLRD